MWGGGDASFGGGAGGMGGGMGGGGGFGSPMDASQDKRQKNFNKGQSIMPVTVAQMFSARRDDDGSFFINEKELNSVSFVGVIRSVQETSTTLSYSVDDMTGEPMMVRSYVQDNEPNRSECREGLYIYIIGHLRAYNDSNRNVIALTIRPMTDFNEITMHMLEVVHAHLFLKKGAAAEPLKANGAMASTAAIGNGMPSMASGGGGGGGSHNAAHGGNQFQNTEQQQVYNAIVACRDAQGLEMSSLLSQMGKHRINEAAVKKAVEFLSQEGHIYSTIDEDHYKSTDDF